MTQRVKAVFFDLGETLVTQNIEDNMITKQALKGIAKLLPKSASQRDLFEIYRRGYRVNHALRSRHHVEVSVQNWMHQLLSKALAKEPEEALVEKAIGFVVSSRAGNAVAFKDVEPTLRRLSQSGKKLAVISNVSSHEAAVEILKRVGIRKYFNEVITSAQTGIRKPDPGIFLYALMKFGLRPSEAVHVGDSEEHDIIGAKAVGIKTVLVSRRSQHKETIADHQFHDLAGAADLLSSL